MFVWVCVCVNCNDRAAEPLGMIGGVSDCGGHSFEETVWTQDVLKDHKDHLLKCYSCVYTVYLYKCTSVCYRNSSCVQCYIQSVMNGMHSVRLNDITLVFVCQHKTTSTQTHVNHSHVSKVTSGISLRGNVSIGAVYSSFLSTGRKTTDWELLCQRHILLDCECEWLSVSVCGPGEQSSVYPTSGKGFWDVLLTQRRIRPYT